MDEKLRPCPFCGQEVKVQDRKEDCTEQEIKTRRSYRVYDFDIECSNCDIPLIQGAASKEIATQMWNNRPIEAELEKKLKLTEDTLSDLRGVNTELQNSCQYKLLNECQRLKKEVAELKEENEKVREFSNKLLYLEGDHNKQAQQIKELEKENAELKAKMATQYNEWEIMYDALDSIRVDGRHLNNPDQDELLLAAEKALRKIEAGAEAPVYLTKIDGQSQQIVKLKKEKAKLVEALESILIPYRETKRAEPNAIWTVLNMAMLERADFILAKLEPKEDGK